jgi:malate dehydrogenase
VQQRGAASIKARGAYSAASAASAAIEHMRDWVTGSGGQWASMGVYSAGNPYGVDEDLLFAFPIVCEDGQWRIIEGLEVSPFSREMIEKTEHELKGERDAVAHLFT